MSCGPGCIVLPTRKEVENFADGERVSETRIFALIDALDTLRGPLCRDPECPDYDGEHPYHFSAVVRAHEAGQGKVREDLERLRAELVKVTAERDEYRTARAQANARLANDQTRDELAEAEARALSVADAATLRAGCHHTQACLDGRDYMCSCGCAAAVALLAGKVPPNGRP